MAVVDELDYTKRFAWVWTEPKRFRLSNLERF